jgi:hypothetical protein
MISFLQKHKTAAVVVLFLSLPLLYYSFVGLRALSGAVEALPENQGGESPGYDAPVQLANLENQSIKESSGVAASRRNSNLFWTHNDSGDGPFLYAFDRQGKHRGVWKVTGASAVDWEDMAIGPGQQRGQPHLYIGDIGDNSRKRDEIVVYRVAEPSIVPKDSSSTNEKPRRTDAADVIRLKYPDGKHDAETLFIHPTTGDLYIVTKVRGSAAGVYKLKAPLPISSVSTLVHIAEVRFPNAFLGFITGGDVSPDARRIILCDYLGACELVLPDTAGVAFDDIWKQALIPVNTGNRRQGEAICYRADGLALLMTSEGFPCPFIEVTLANRSH